MYNLFHKRLKAFYNAFCGVQDMMRTQVHARIHAIIGVSVIIAGIAFRIERWEWCLLALSIASVLAFEAINTALEVLTDLVTPDYHPLARRAKDVAAGAVLLMVLGAVAVGLLIFSPRMAPYLMNE